MAITSTVPRGPVTATLNYFTPPADNAPPFNHVDTPPAGQPQRNFTDAPVATLIHDIRGREAAFTLDRDGVAVVFDDAEPASAVRAALAVAADAAHDDDNDDNDDDNAAAAAIAAAYYPAVERLLRQHVPGARRVVVFDHTVRRARPGAAGRAPVTRVHIDQTAAAAALRVRRHLGGEAEALLRGRYRIINVWRPLNKKPVESFPLAFASSYSVDDADVIPVEHRYSSGYTGFTAAIKHNPNQRWNYLSGMTDSEMLLLECFDSEALKENTTVSGGRLAHTAFEDPRTHPDAEGRESIEVRTLVFGP